MDIVTMWENVRPYEYEAALVRIAQEKAPRRRSTTTKLGILAVACTACFALGIAWANGGLDEPVATADVGLSRAPEALPAPVDRYTVDEVVVVAKAPRKAPLRARRAIRSCVDHRLEITGGSVSVCDVPRTANAKPRLWVPIAKPTRLAARDLPSPSGLLD